MSEVYNYQLNRQTIDEISEKIGDFCLSTNNNKSVALTTRLNAEEAMIRWMEAGFTGKNILLILGRKLLTPFIELRLEGRADNPFEDDSEELGAFSRNLLSTLEIAPVYSVQGSRTCLRFTIPKKKLGQLQQLLLVIIAAAAVGFLGKAVLPADVLTFIIHNLIEPISDTFYTILGCIAGPMIFLSVAWGIYGIGDSGTFGKVGKGFMIGFFLITFLAAVSTLIAFPVIGPELGENLNGGSQFGSVFEMILGIFPSNILSPFIDGNTLQIIFMSTIVGIALIFLGEMTSSVAKAIEQINYLVIFLMKFISGLVPYVVFIVIIKLVWSDTVGIIAGIWKFFAVLLAAFFLVMAVFTILPSVKYKIPLRTILKKNFPTYLIAITTASSAASFSSNMDVTQNKFGIRKNVASFGVPLGMVINKPATAIYNMLIVLFFTAQSGIEVDLAWIVTMTVTVALVSVSTPPVPGGGALAYALLFSQAGIPQDVLSVVLAIDIITDFFVTSTEMYCLPLSLMLRAARLNMIDFEIVRKDSYDD